MLSLYIYIDERYKTYANKDTISIMSHYTKHSFSNEGIQSFSNSSRPKPRNTLETYDTFSRLVSILLRVHYVKTFPATRRNMSQTICWNIWGPCKNDSKNEPCFFHWTVNDRWRHPDGAVKRQMKLPCWEGRKGHSFLAGPKTVAGNSCWSRQLLRFQVLNSFADPGLSYLLINHLSLKNNSFETGKSLIQIHDIKSQNLIFFSELINPLSIS